MVLVNKIKNYIVWKKRVKEKEVIDLDRGCGYYIPVWFWGLTEQRGRVETLKMKDGSSAICKLIDYEVFGNPNDMIENGYYQILGYVGEKLYKDMTFNEYQNSLNTKTRLSKIVS